MNLTAAGIGSIAGRLERLYEGRHQRFGIHTFRVIRIKAEEVQRDVSAVTKEQAGSALELAVKRLDEGIVSLVVSFRCVRRLWRSSLLPGCMDMLRTEAIQGRTSKRTDCMHVGLCSKG